MVKGFKVGDRVRFVGTPELICTVTRSNGPHIGVDCPGVGPVATLASELERVDAVPMSDGSETAAPGMLQAMMGSMPTPPAKWSAAAPFQVGEIVRAKDCSHDRVGVVLASRPSRVSVVYVDGSERSYAPEALERAQVTLADGDPTLLWHRVCERFERLDVEFTPPAVVPKQLIVGPVEPSELERARAAANRYEVAMKEQWDARVAVEKERDELLKDNARLRREVERLERLGRRGR